LLVNVIVIAAVWFSNIWSVTGPNVTVRAELQQIGESSPHRWVLYHVPASEWFARGGLVQVMLSYSVTFYTLCDLSESSLCRLPSSRRSW